MKTNDKAGRISRRMMKGFAARSGTKRNAPVSVAWGQPKRRRAVGGEGSAALDPELLRKMDAYWRAANYLSVGQIYLLNNPLLRRPLKHADIKPRLLGHWGTTPGLNFIYVHLNRIIK